MFDWHPVSNCGSDVFGKGMTTNHKEPTSAQDHIQSRGLKVSLIPSGARIPS